MSTTHLAYTFPSGLTLEIAQGDLTQEPVDAIVNAANAYLQHGGGVAGAIAARGGPSIQAESSDWVRLHGPVAHDEPAWTGAGDLPCHYVIHAVGPIWGQGDEDMYLGMAVMGSLDRAELLHCASLALPALSTGIFGFPRPRAASIILGVTRDWASEHPFSGLRRVRLVLFDQPALEDFLVAAAEVLA